MTTRDEKGRFTTKTAEEINYGFYSKVLNKPFDTLEELKAAEDEYTKAEEAKKAKSLEKKNDAGKVEEAFKALNAAKTEYNKTVSEAKKVAMKLITDAKSAYASAVAEADKALEKAEDCYNTALKEFTEKHPEGYHMTLRDGDIVTDITRSASSGVFNNLNELYDSFRSFFELF